MRNNSHNGLGLKKTALALGTAVVAMGGSAFAGTGVEVTGSDVTGGPVADESSIFDKIWGLPVLYENNDNPYIQKVYLQGRYQGQWFNLDSDDGDADEWETRRWRLGGGIKFLKKFEIKGDVNIDEDFDPAYKSTEELYLTYKHSDALKLTVGKHKPKFTHEWSTSSRKILTFERSLLVNQILPDKSAGVTVGGDLENGISYSAGVFSGIDIVDPDDFGDVDDEGEFYNFKVSKEIDENSAVTLDYLYNNDPELNSATAPYDHAVSLSYTTSHGKFGLATDLIYGNGDDGVSDVFGLVILPTYNITDKLQAVARYHYANASDNNGLRLQSRYERRAPALTGDRGDEYHSIYAGLNYYLYDHKLKLMAGVEYSDMSDDASDGGEFDAFTTFLGVRLYF